MGSFIASYKYNQTIISSGFFDNVCLEYGYTMNALINNDINKLACIDLAVIGNDTFKNHLYFVSIPTEV